MEFVGSGVNVSICGGLAFFFGAMLLVWFLFLNCVSMTCYSSSFADLLKAFEFQNRNNSSEYICFVCVSVRTHTHIYILVMTNSVRWYGRVLRSEDGD